MTVGQLVVTRATGWDALSSTDFQVQVRRRDRVVEARVAVLSNQVEELTERSERLHGLISQLELKKAQSEIRPGPPLTDLEQQLLVSLSAIPPLDRQPIHRVELDRLNRKLDESRRQPGPPLTEEEDVRFLANKSSQQAVLQELEIAENEHSRALALIRGQTRIMDSDFRVMDFDSGPLLTVYEGDSLRVTVVDRDVFDDDLIGQRTFTVTRQILERGTITLESAGAVRSLELYFVLVRAGRTWD